MAAPAWATQDADDAALAAFLDAAHERQLAGSPETLTRLGRKTGYDRLDDPSASAEAALLEARRRSVAEMQARFGRARLSDMGRTSFDLWVLALERAETTHRWRTHRYIFDRNGPHTGYPNFLINAHRVETPADMEAWIARAAAIGPALDEHLAAAKTAAARGIRAPRFAYDQSLAEVRRLTSGAPFGVGADAALWADAKAKAEALVSAGKLDTAGRDHLLLSARSALTGSMKPAYDRVAAWLSEDRSKADAAPRGVGDLPDGAAYYAAMLRLQTTTELSAEAIHDLGLAEVTRIRAEMEALKAKIGFPGSLADFFVHMRTADQFYVPNTDAGRADYLKRTEAFLADMRAALPAVFSRQPRSEVVVRRVEAFREEPGGAAHYVRGALDGSRPGVYYVHLADTRATPIYEIEGTAYHEAWPGHHMQISLAQELTGLPAFRTQGGYGAYVEGWGLYVEALAKEMGFYRDPYSDFGRLGREIWRAIRLVVDTGIHAKGWSEDQALTFYRANSPQPEGKIRSEIRRYFVMPGQATSYKVGMVRIQALRSRAQAKLGGRFDIKAFHDVVLNGGALPLDVLERRIDAFIQARG
jgi:uncharacterized protein (DUF885 family)